MKLKYFLFLFLTLTIFHQTSSIATIRYVSKTGTSTPPYTSWATAADSIQKCINICSFGDTVYVGNGIYKEQVVMVTGLSLIGNGLDSCIIDSRELIFSTSAMTVNIKDSCLLIGFQIIVASDTEFGRGIGGTGGKSTQIMLNRITSAKYGIYPGGDLTIYNNICDNISTGIYVFNSNSLVRKNIVNANVQSTIVAGIRIEAFNYNYYPVIDSNYIETVGDGIRKSFGTRPTITNNTISYNNGGNFGIFLSSSDSTKIYNNSILVRNTLGIGEGISNSGTQFLQLENNLLIGKYNRIIVFGPNNKIKNNAITDAEGEFNAWGSENLLYQYNNIWNSETSFAGFKSDSTNLEVNPMVINDDSTRGELDFHLQKYSPLIDAGDSTILDRDGSRSDIGLYGGPYGESYKYIDLAPSVPINLTALVDSNYITLNWNRNTEADTSFYKVYRDTVINFTIDSTKLISSSADTFFVQINPHNITKYVYKVTCVDKQGNESLPSEEKVVNITSVSINDYPMVISDYRLYQNYPNPFNPSTTISYRLKERGYVKLYVYDIKGELVSVLVNKVQESGFYQVDFSSSHIVAGSIQNQEPSIQNLASGVYIYQIHVIGENNIPVFTDIKKMIYLK